MRIGEVRIMVGWMLGTAAVVLAVLLPGVLVAEDGVRLTPVKQGKLTISGAEVSVSLVDAPQAEAGKLPVYAVNALPKMELVAKNTTDHEVTVEVRASVSATAARNPLSRTPGVPSVIWHEDQKLTLGPGVTKRAAMKVDRALAPGSEGAILLAPVDGDARATISPVSFLMAKASDLPVAAK